MSGTTLVDISWTAKAQMPTARWGLAVGVVNNKIYAVGGYNSGVSSAVNALEEYDPMTNLWATKAPMPAGREQLAVGVVNNKIYAIGGYGVPCPNHCDIVEEYDPATDTWTTKTPMPVRRLGLAVGVIGGKIYAIGGRDENSSYLITVHEYDPVTDTWSVKAPMPTARGRLSVAVVNDKIYAIGGYNGSTLNTVEAYDPATDSWSNCGTPSPGNGCTPMPTGRWYLAISVVNDRIYAIGGVGGAGGILATVEEYDPVTNSWATKTSMPTGRYFLRAGVVNNKIYPIGGYDGSFLDTVEEGTVSGTLPAWNNPPTADASIDQNATVGVTVNFNGAASDYESDPLSFAWDFDYQSGVFTQDAISQSASHTYTATGTYTAVLQVTDSKGASNKDSLVVTVNP